MYKNNRDKLNVPLMSSLLFGLLLLSSLLFRHEVVAGNVWAMGISLGGMPRETAERVIREKALQIENGQVVFTAGSLTVEMSADDVGLLMDESMMLRSLDGYVSSTPRVWPAFLSRLGAKKVMAAPVTVILPQSKDILHEIASQLSRDAQGVRYGFSGKDLLVLPPSDGQIVTREDVALALETIEETRVDVNFAALPAPTADDLPVLELIGEFSTGYNTEDTDRNINLSLAAEAVHGKLLNPGDVYSFNQEAGERTEEKGYRYANVVVGDHLEPGLAGGICQVTTTLFDAAAFAGLDFPYVTAHGIPVNYVPPGMDAAVAWDYLDLKIKNNTEGPVVFGAWVEDGQVTVRVFGKSSGYTYEIEPVTVREYPSPGKRPGLLVETFRIEKSGGREVSRTLIMRSTYQPSYPPPEK